MNYKLKLFSVILAVIFIFQIDISAQNVKRIVIFKADGLPNDFIDKFVKQKDPKTGKSVLPWFDHIFYKNGTRVSNFYTRGMSLSGPAWSVLDTGQHLQIKGNVEYDRFTLKSYDYLNFFPYQIRYGLKKSSDMPGVEVLDQLKIPVLLDAFKFEDRYNSYQLFQRGNSWGLIALGFLKLFPTNPNDLIDEWTIGFNYRDASIVQSERYIIKKLTDQPYINYFDYFTGSFDHISHHNNDIQSRIKVLKDIDATLGRIWTGIEKAPRADETAFVIISDHGFNSDEKVYSQGFNIVKFLASAEGGGHHVITKRRLMLDYSIKGIYPLIPLITTASNDSYYLKGESSSYPTALVDFDGNERSSLHLRDNDLNILHILLKNLQSGNLSPKAERAATDAFFEVLKRRREGWLNNFKGLSEELDALHRWIELQQPIIAAQPKKYTPEEIAKGKNEEDIRLVAQTDIAIKDEQTYREYLRILSNLLLLNRDSFNPKNMKIEDYIAKGAMEERNSVYDLQNYVVGLSEEGIVLNSNDDLDYEKTFKRVNYFELLENRTVRNNVQKGISNRPIDFIGTSIPLDSISSFLSSDLIADENPIWLYGNNDKQALILTRVAKDGVRSIRYLPISDLKQDSSGKYTFQIKEWDNNFPLKLFEDENLNISGNKSAWLNGWHTESEWMKAIHKTQYSNGLIGLNEQLDDHPLKGFENENKNQTADEKLIQNFHERQRLATKADILLLANNHWNFDVRGFNPGGNHGSFFRVSTNSTFMIAGGAKTNIPKGLNIETPYDSLSFVPTILAMMGKVDKNNEPIPELYERGFRKFPGVIVQELVNLPK